MEREHESSQTKLTIEDLLIKTHILTNLASEEKTNSGYKEEMKLIDREVPSEEFHEVAFTEYCLFGKPVEVEDSDVRDKSTGEKKTCGRMTNHKLSGKKLLSHAETEKVNNNSRLL
ncbi:hypothetical protein HID58_013152 [Brassica napus]|uniref:DExH14 plug domain-containing protein n=1 Tax=Brassica napus TaxID=3708 RepID=A0ABQ8E340_BRANA|nr:hypothetical protein HID58_013152 [Brassica napus]